MCTDTVLGEEVINNAFPFPSHPLCVTANADTSHVWFEWICRLPTGLEPGQLIYGHEGERGLKGQTFFCCALCPSLSLSLFCPQTRSVGIFPQNSLTFHMNALYRRSLQIKQAHNKRLCGAMREVEKRDRHKRGCEKDIFIHALLHQCHPSLP